MLEIMNYMYNNIEKLNKCNLSTNKYGGNKSYDNKPRLIELICVRKWKWGYQNKCINYSSVDANIEDWTDWFGGQSRFCLVTNQIKYNEQYSPRLDKGCQYFRQAQHPRNRLVGYKPPPQQYQQRFINSSL